MADPHGHDSHAAHDSHASDHAAEEEDAVRTPLWLPFVGLGLLLVGAISSYLWVYPGTLSAPAVGAEAGSGDASAEAGAVNAAAPQPQMRVIAAPSAH